MSASSPQAGPKCVICTEAYTSARTKVQCPACDHVACVICVQTYLLTQPEPRCMGPSCGKMFTRNFMTKNLRKTFITGKYKKHREDILYQQELSLLPQSQIYVKNYARISSLSHQKSALNTLITEKRQEERSILMEIQDLQVRKANVMDTIRRARQNLYTEYEYDDGIGDGGNRGDGSATADTVTDTNTNPKEVTRRLFVRKCAFNDCMGYVSTQWKCGICDKYTCKHCHEGIKDGEHTCLPENVASAKLIASDSRPCPKCTANIYRIDGCPAMFCTECKTCFNWNTGHITNSNSNPHYAEWLRNAPPLSLAAENGVYELDCGQDIVWIDAAIHRRQGYHRPIRPFGTTLSRRARHISHIQEIVVPTYRARDPDLHRELRLKLLTKSITHEQFKRRIQQNEKKNAKNTEMHDILTFLVSSATDMHRREYRSGRLPYDVPEDYQTESDNLVEYVNTTLANISAVYGSTLYQISPEFKYGRCTEHRNKSTSEFVVLNDNDGEVDNSHESGSESDSDSETADIDSDA